MRTHVFITFIISLGAHTLAVSASSRLALEIASVERALQHNFESLHSDTIAQFKDEVWNLDTGRQLAGPDQVSNFALISFNPGELQVLGELPEKGLMIDFAPTTQRAAYRTRTGGVEVRSRDDKVLFESAHTDSLAQKEAYLIDEGDFILIRTAEEQGGAPLLQLYSVQTGEKTWERRGGLSVSWTILDDTLTCLEIRPSETVGTGRSATLIDLEDATEIQTLEIPGEPVYDFPFPDLFPTWPSIHPAEYLHKIENPVLFLALESATLMSNGTTRNLAILDGISAGPLPINNFSTWGQSPTTDSASRYHILVTRRLPTQNGEDEPLIRVVDAQEGIVVSTSFELRQNDDISSEGNYHTLSADGRLFIKAMHEGPIEVWSLETKTLVGQFSIPGVVVACMASSADSNKLFVNGVDEEQRTFAALLDIETGQSLYQLSFDHPNVFEYTTESDIPPGFHRRLSVSPGNQRVYFQSPRGIEAFAFETGEKISLSQILRGSAVISRFVESESAWVTVYETGKVFVESPQEPEKSNAFQLPNDGLIRFATVDEDSGSIAFKRERISYRHNGERYEQTSDYSIVVSHPFDERADQNLPFDHRYYEESKLRLLGGGRWLVAPYTGLIDLETEEAYNATRTVSTNDAYHYESRKWADREQWSIKVSDLGNNTSTILDTSHLFSDIRVLRFSDDGNTLYCLARPIGSSDQKQSVFILDSSNGNILSEIRISIPPRSSGYSKMQLGSDEERLILGDWNSTACIVNLETGTTGIPHKYGFWNPMYLPSLYFDIAPPLPSSETRSVDIYGNIYNLRTTSTQLIPSALTFREQSKGELVYQAMKGREYWIQASYDLKLWETHQNTDFVKSWFDSHDKGFFRVYETETGN